MLDQAPHLVAASNTSDVIIWSFVLLALLIVGFTAAAQLKRRMRDDEDAATGAATGFTLSDLRQLRRDGKLSDDEFERAKEKILGAAKIPSKPVLSKPAENEELGNL